MQTKHEEDFEFDLTINTKDTAVLMEQLQRNPNQYFHVGKSFEKAKKLVADLKLQIKIKESEIATSLRKVLDKISEARIEKSYYDDKSYIDLNVKLNEAKLNEGYLGAMLKALEMKHSIMITVASLIKAELRQQI